MVDHIEYFPTQMLQTAPVPVHRMHTFTMLPAVEVVVVKTTTTTAAAATITVVSKDTDSCHKQYCFLATKYIRLQCIILLYSQIITY